MTGERLNGGAVKAHLVEGEDAVSLEFPRISLVEKILGKLELCPLGFRELVQSKFFLLESFESQIQL